MGLLTRIFNKNKSNMCFTSEQINRFNMYMIEKYNAGYMSYTSKIQRQNTVEFRMYFRKNKSVTFRVRNGFVKILENNDVKDITNKKLQQDWDMFVEYARRDLDYTIAQNSKQKDQSVENEETKNI